MGDEVSICFVDTEVCPPPPSASRWASLPCRQALPSDPLNRSCQAGTGSARHRV